MAEINDRLRSCLHSSNPTSKAECSVRSPTATPGRSLFARGSPFGSGKIDGKTFVAAPGATFLHLPPASSRRGLRSIKAVDRQRCSWLLASTTGLSRTPQAIGHGSLYPALPRIRMTSSRRTNAVAVAEVALQSVVLRPCLGRTTWAFIESQITYPHIEPEPAPCLFAVILWLGLDCSRRRESNPRMQLGICRFSH